MIKSKVQRKLISFALLTVVITFQHGVNLELFHGTVQFGSVFSCIYMDAVNL